MDYFVPQALLTEEGLPDKHMDDPRFSGVYFLLATLLPSEKARRLREHLTAHSVRTKKRQNFDRFIEGFLQWGAVAA